MNTLFDVSKKSLKKNSYLRVGSPTYKFLQTPFTGMLRHCTSGKHLLLKMGRCVKIKAICFFLKSCSFKNNKNYYKTYKIIFYNLK